jgi:hypothetical protein
LIKQLLEAAGLREVNPYDVLPPDQVDAFLKTFPDVGGNRYEIGHDDFTGTCGGVSDQEWWRHFVKK